MSPLIAAPPAVDLPRLLVAEELLDVVLDLARCSADEGRRDD
jgi:hypothetical protein